MSSRASAPEVFRPRLLLTLAMGFAGAVWIVVLWLLLQYQDIPLRLLLGAGFFVLFFAVALAYYARTAIFVDAAGVTYRGVLRTLRLSFGEIRKLDVLPGFVTVYAIRGKRKGMHFTSFFCRHRRLMELVVDRARLVSA